MGRAVPLASLLACWGCGSPGGSPDARPATDALDLVPGPNVVTVQFFDPPSYIRYRNGASGWGEPERVTDVEYRLHVTDAYEMIYTCVDDFYVESELLGRTFADGDQLLVFNCFSDDSPPPPPLVTVTGSAMQAGVVYMGGDVKMSSVAPWNFALEMYAGTQDLIALDTTQRIAIRRAIDVAGTTALPPIDFAQEGVPLDTQPYTVFDVEPDETLSADTYFFTEHEWAFLNGSATHFLTVPSASLVEGDAQYLSVAASSDSTDRSVLAPFGGPTAFSLMPRLAKNALTYSVPDNRTLRGDWTMLPELDKLELVAFNYAMQRATITKRFIEATNRSYIAFDTPLDFDVTWRVDLRQEYYRFIVATRSLGDATYDTWRSDVVDNVLGN